MTRRLVYWQLLIKAVTADIPLGVCLYQWRRIELRFSRHLSPTTQTWNSDCPRISHIRDFGNASMLQITSETIEPHHIPRIVPAMELLVTSPDRVVEPKSCGLRFLVDLELSIGATRRTPHTILSLAAV